MMAKDPESQESFELALFRRTVETLLERGASPAEALEGATLVVQAHRRQSAVWGVRDVERLHAPASPARGAR